MNTVLGIEIPADLSTLTTDELPHYAMGQWAVQYLLNHAEEPPSDPIQHRIACPLIGRASI